MEIPVNESAELILSLSFSCMLIEELYLTNIKE